MPAQDGEGGSDDEEMGVEGSDRDGEGGIDDDGGEGSSGEDDYDDDDEEEEGAGAGRKGVKRARESDGGAGASDDEDERKAKRPATEGSLRQLKKAAAVAKAAEEGVLPIEQGRFLGPEDFERIKALKAGVRGWRPSRSLSRLLPR